MPNWVKNRITMPGIRHLPIYATNDDGSVDFDFNTLIPMPPELDVMSGVYTEEAIIYYLTERCTVPIEKLPDNTALLTAHRLSGLTGSIDWALRNFDLVADKMADADDTEKEKMYNAGKSYVDNIRNFHAPTWYEWRLQNWGTKWNASETRLVGDDVLVFDTAWSYPEPVIEALSKKFPGVSIKAEWSDEDIGSNCGVAIFKDGEWEYHNLKNGSEAALSLYEKLHGSICNIKHDENGRPYFVSCEDCTEQECMR